MNLIVEFSWLISNDWKTFMKMEMYNMKKIGMQKMECVHKANKKPTTHNQKNRAIAIKHYPNYG